MCPDAKASCRKWTPYHSAASARRARSARSSCREPGSRSRPASRRATMCEKPQMPMAFSSAPGAHRVADVDRRVEASSRQEEVGVVRAGPRAVLHVDPLELEVGAARRVHALGRSCGRRPASPRVASRPGRRRGPTPCRAPIRGGRAASRSGRPRGPGTRRGRCSRGWDPGLPRTGRRRAAPRAPGARAPRGRGAPSSGSRRGPRWKRPRSGGARDGSRPRRAARRAGGRRAGAHAPGDVPECAASSYGSPSFRVGRVAPTRSGPKPGRRRRGRMFRDSARNG